MSIVVGGLEVLGRGAVAGLAMLWSTLWALVVGFVLAGAVRTVVDPSALERRLGDHRARSVARATAFGAASSSCSYAAAATTRSLLTRGADAVSSVVFLVASTNLVVELGVVVLGLLGWQLLGTEAAGGLVMVVLVGLLGARVLRGRALERARSSDGPAQGHCCHHEGAGDAPQAQLGRPSLRRLDAWGTAARAGLSDLSMVRRELVVGFLVAGVLAVAVPQHAWSAVLVRGHGPWTPVENALFAPLVAMASCVCSVGNVPLAAVLWHAGIGLAGTLAFLLADLLALPLVLVYRRYFGVAFTLRLVALLYAAIVLATLAVAGGLALLGLTPTAPAHAQGIPTVGTATDVLNVAALLALAALLLAGRRHGRSTTAGAPVEALVAPR